MPKKYQATISVFSDYGNTPVTNRGGSYCDHIAEIVEYFETPAEARAAAVQAAIDTEHGYSAFYEMPDHPNQNTRHGWVNTATAVNEGGAS